MYLEDMKLVIHVYKTSELLHYVFTRHCQGGLIDLLKQKTLNRAFRLNRLTI